MKKSLKISIVFIITIIFLIIFLIYPLIKEIKKSSEDFLALKKELILIKKEAEYLKEFEKKYQSLKLDLKKAKDLLINPELPVDFIEFLEKIAKDSEVLIEISSLAAKKIKEDPWPSLKFQIIGKSSFANFLKFLEKLENSPYLIEVENLSATKSKEELGELSLAGISINLSIKVFTK
jgi:Tfp pilus assembly protein PilN